MRLQEQGDRTADDGGGLARAGAAEQSSRCVTGDEALRVADIDRGSGRTQADHGGAGRHQVGVASGSDPLAEVGQHRPVPPADLAERVRSTDSEHERVQRRVGDVTRARPVIADRGHHHDASPPSGLDGRGQRVNLVGLERVGPEGEVDDTYVHAVVVAVRDGPGEARDDRVHRDDSVGSGQLDREEPGIRRQALLDVRRCRLGRHGPTVLIRSRVPGGDQPGHEGAVAERVTGTGRVRPGQVGPQHDLAHRVQAGHGGNPGVEQRDRHARTRERTARRVGVLPQLAGSGGAGERVEGAGVLVGAVDLAVGQRHIVGLLAAPLRGEQRQRAGSAGPGRRARGRGAGGADEHGADGGGRHRADATTLADAPGDHGHGWSCPTRRMTPCASTPHVARRSAMRRNLASQSGASVTDLRRRSGRLVSPRL